MHCFTMFITALCVIFLYATLMAEEQESVWPVHHRVSREDSGIPESAEATLSSAIKVPIAFSQCVQISTHETLRKKGDNTYFMILISLPKFRTKLFS